MTSRTPKDTTTAEQTLWRLRGTDLTTEVERHNRPRYCLWSPLPRREVFGPGKTKIVISERIKKVNLNDINTQTTFKYVCILNSLSTLNSKDTFTSTYETLLPIFQSTKFFGISLRSSLFIGTSGTLLYSGRSEMSLGLTFSPETSDARRVHSWCPAVLVPLSLSARPRVVHKYQTQVCVVHIWTKIGG